MAAPVILPILTVLRSAGINAAGQAVKGLSGNMAGLASQLGRAAGAFAAFQGITTAQDFLGNAAASAQRLERNMVALDQVFEDQSITMQGFVRDVEAYGMSQEQAARAAVFTGSVLKQSGFTIEETAKQTQRLVKLAVDLSATFGYDVQEALLGMTALFRGEYDPIEKFGVAMKQNEINAELAARGLDDLEGAERRLAEQQIRLQFLFERGGDAIGAYTRLSETLFVQQTQLTAEFANLQAAAGERLQQPLADLIASFREIMDDAGPGIIEVVDGLGGSIEVATPLLKQLGTLFFELVELMNPVVQILNVALSPAFLLLEGGLKKVNALLEFTNELFAAGGTYLDIWAERIDKLVSEENMPFFNKLLEMNEQILKGTDRAYEIVLESLQEFNASQMTGAELADVFAKSLEEEEKRLLALKPAAEAAAGAIQTLFMSDVTGRVTSRQGVAYASRYGALEEYAKGAFPELFETEKKSASAVVTDYVAEFFNSLTESVEQETARIELEGLGLSETFIDQILGSSDWQGVFDEIIEGGKAFAEELQSQFDKTAAGAAGFIDDFYDGIEEEIERQQARLELMSLGLSPALIEEILNASGWQSVFDQIAEGGKEMATSLQESFNQTAAGIKELQDIAAAEAAAAQAAADLIAQQAQDAYNKAAQAAAEHNKQVDELEQNVSKLTESFRKSQQVPSGLPPLQQEILDFTASLRDAINAAEKSVLNTRNRETLLQFIDDQEMAMLSVARLRGDLEKERKAIEADVQAYDSIYDSLYASVIGTGQITSMGTSARVITARLTDAIEDAKEFQDDLVELRKLGLSQSLLQQIQSAGVQAGGATAEALIKGGPAAVSEINALYAELESTADVIGTQAGESMFDAGIDVMNGLIEGIIAQENQVAMAAEMLANVFSDTFNMTLQEGTVRQVAPSLEAFKGYYSSKADFQNFVAEEMIERGMTSIKYSPGEEVFGQIAPTPPRTERVGNTNITINAGVGTDGTELGRIIVDAIARYESTNGKVYASA